MSDSMFSVQDRVVLVSGGSRGIGRSLAEGFVERGARVVIASRDAATLEQTSREISKGTHPVTPVVCDVSQPDQISKMVETVVEKLGRIDVLLNVAGINVRKRVEEYTVEEFDKILDINLKGAFLVAQQVGRKMIAQRQGGALINIDSLNSFRPLKGVQPYAMSKAAVSAMTRGMAMEWGEHGIRVNAIAPGFILTDLTKKLWSDPTMQAWNDANCPMKRLGQPEDLIGTAVFLASDAAKFLTGQVIYVDGGITCGMQWPIPFDNPSLSR
ncbi:SDR family NAD(P)-dependent oxidoreductase [Schlesneria paludicola]|uniref:SDR family NAD(P)-dependent oxidoreductase n=1 Tax=Schlesneria paludicola TaxID=360056 RepID=UPI00029AC9B7|nr:glucose 1-dehydrogenase [Schlesneria paludicola]